MRTLLTILILALSLNLSAQDKPKLPVSTKDTIINKVSHRLYIGSKGGKYIIVTSKTGKVYKRYFTAKK